MLQTASSAPSVAVPPPPPAKRALQIDTVALGLLRKNLIDNFGEASARLVLTQFGFSQGWRLAEAAKTEFTWASDDDWANAGPRLHESEGLFRLGAPPGELRSSAGIDILSSFETEAQLSLLGRPATPSCWSLCGMLSGYLSRACGEDFVVVEDRCVSLGDASCRMHARPRSEWGQEHAEAVEAFNRAPLKEVLNESLQRVAVTLKEAERRLTERRRALKAMGNDFTEPTGIVARSAAMKRVIDLARRVEKVDATVLITGESGAGKERIARLVHDESARARGPFIAINCGAIAETLLESELFGHSRGSFTGANQDRPGLFEAANGGTLLLDEVGEVSAGMQVKLLRVLQEREVRRVGENRSRPIDVRVLAATNRDLAHGVAGGAFRQDLYYRLKVVELNVPPLRERRDDVLPLANVLLLDAATRMKRSLAGLSPGAAERLLDYEWPGNVRELENAMARAVALAQGDRINEEDLPDELVPRPHALAAAAPTAGPVRPLEDIERDYILSALQQNGGNQTQTAVQLKIGSATLYRKLKSYGRLSGHKTEPLS